MTVSLIAADAGFVTEAGGSAKGDGTVAPGATNNYSAGRAIHFITGDLGSPTAPMDRKNYFVFDLTVIPATITSARLVLYAGPAGSEPYPFGPYHGYESFDPSETYGLAATSDMAGALADAAALKVGNTVGPAEFDEPTDPLIGMAAALYAKLAAGPMPLASKELSSMDDGRYVGLPFTPAGVAFLNSFTGGPIIVGGKVLTAVPPATPQSVFGFTETDLTSSDLVVPYLSVTYVPEPGACALAICAFGTMALIRRRPRKR